MHADIDARTSMVEVSGVAQVLSIRGITPRLRVQFSPATARPAIRKSMIPAIGHNAFVFERNCASSSSPAPGDQ